MRSGRRDFLIAAVRPLRADDRDCTLREMAGQGILVRSVQDQEREDRGESPIQASAPAGGGISELRLTGRGVAQSAVRDVAGHSGILGFHTKLLSWMVRA